MTEQRYLSKEETQQVTCPQCDAIIGVPCFPSGTRGRRDHNHAVRVTKAASFLGIKLPHDRFLRQFHQRGGAGR